MMYRVDSRGIDIIPDICAQVAYVKKRSLSVATALILPFSLYISLSSSMFAFNTSVYWLPFYCILKLQVSIKLERYNWRRWVSPVRDMSVHIEKDIKENTSIFKSQFTKDPPLWKADFLPKIC